MEKIVEIYYESAYIKEFDAAVISCKERKDGKYDVILDRTAFFPEQGGQSSDIGTIVDENGAEHNVNHVSIKNEYRADSCENLEENINEFMAVIRHVVDTPLTEGENVHGVIDWAHRFSNMQQHTGEHIFSGIVASEYGYDNVGFHLSDTEVTMDYNGLLTSENIRDIELKVNRAIWENVPVICEFPDKQTLKSLNYRSKKELSGDVRIVTVKGYDVCACCAPHVEHTGEIGILKVTGLQNYKGGVRVNILCGKRALEYIISQQLIVDELSRQFTTSFDNIIPSVKKLTSENADLKGELSATKEKLIEYELKEIPSDKENVILVKDESTDGNSMRKIVNLLSQSHAGFCGVFAGTDEKGYKFVFSSGQKKKDLNEVIKVLREDFGAKGGGNAQMIQGSLSAIEISDVLGKIEEL